MSLAQCDGRTPACQRCINRQIARTCHYELHSKVAKDQMMSEIERLRMTNEDLVQRHRALDEKNDLLEIVVRALKNDDRSHEILYHLKRGESIRSIAEQLGRPLVADLRHISPESERQLNTAIERYRQHWVESQDPCFWTNVTTVPVLVEHLVTLYLTRIHPLHVLFDEQEFMSSFRKCEDVYCSSSLVNAICAMACHVLRSEWHRDDSMHGGIDHLQSRFMDEVEELQRDVVPPKMVAIQTWAIMFLVELGRGNGLMASAHLRNATELLIARTENEQAETSAEVASWGILTLATYVDKTRKYTGRRSLTLDSTWAGLVYQKPNAPVSPHALVFRDVPVQRIKPFRPARGQQVQDEVDGVQTDDCLSSAYQQAKLYRIVHEVLLSYCGSRGKVSGSEMISIYERLLNWKKELPTETKDAGNEDEGPHHLLFLFVQYHVTAVQTLQPMLYTHNTDEKSEKYLIRTILQHAKIAFNILVRYCEIYTFYYQSPIQLFCIIHICDALAQYDSHDSTIPEVIEFALHALEEASVGYPIARIMRDTFRQSVAERHLTLPTQTAQQLNQKSPYLPHDVQNAFTRSTFKQPIAQLLPVLDDSLGRDFAALLEKRQEDELDMGRTEQSRLDIMQIRAVLHQEDSY
ncbi:MAG: hypothetical protein Q9219_006731 [cf. Caloplaca sp. 3 TL-2023]